MKQGERVNFCAERITPWKVAHPTETVRRGAAKLRSPLRQTPPAHTPVHSDRMKGCGIMRIRPWLECLVADLHLTISIMAHYCANASSHSRGASGMFWNPNTGRLAVINTQLFSSCFTWNKGEPLALALLMPECAPPGMKTQEHVVREARSEVGNAVATRKPSCSVDVPSRRYRLTLCV